MNGFMERAIELAIANVESGGQPFGAVLVKEGQVIAEGVNELHLKYDVSGHAELLAIRRAQEQLQTDDLSDCTIYASGEPCAMCLTAMYFAGIQHVYYSASIAEAAKVGLEKSKQIYADLTKENKDRSLVMIQVPGERGQKNPMQLWQAKMERRTN